MASPITPKGRVHLRSQIPGGTGVVSCCDITRWWLCGPVLTPCPHPIRLSWVSHTLVTHPTSTPCLHRAVPECSWWGPQSPQVPRRRGGEGMPGRCLEGAGGGGGWHEAMVVVYLPLAAPIGLSPLHIPTFCGSERVLVVSTRGGRGGGGAKANEQS